MNKGTDGRLTTEQFSDMYGNLPHDSIERVQIENLLKRNHHKNSNNRSQSDVNTESHISQHPRLDLFPAGLNSMDEHFSLMSQRMTNQFNKMREDMNRNFTDYGHHRIGHHNTNDNNDNNNDYSFSKKTTSHTFVGDDGEKYTKTSVKTHKYNDGKQIKSSKKVYKKGNNEVQFITHDDGREQIVGNREIVNDFPNEMTDLSGYKLTNGKH